MNKTLQQKKEEIIEETKKGIEVCKTGIQKREKTISDILNGQELQTTDENGMPKFHPKYQEIRAIDFEISQLKSCIQKEEKEIKDLESGEMDHFINATYKN
jgi:hypothetical protein